MVYDDASTSSMLFEQRGRTGESLFVEVNVSEWLKSLKPSGSVTAFCFNFLKNKIKIKNRNE